MNIRKITGSLLASLLAPIVFLARWLPNVFGAIFYQRYNYYDFHITSLGELLCAVYCQTFLPVALAAFIFIFIPFQITKDHFLRKGRRLTFLGKAGLLSGTVLIVIIVCGLFSNIWMIPWHKNLFYIVFALGFSAFFTTLLYFLVDRHEETKSSRS